MLQNPIASDDNNTEFAGAHDPDGRLAVMFYSKPVKNEFESHQQGRPKFVDVDFVKIMMPGDKNTIIDTPAREDHKERFPKQWAHYQNKHSGDAREIGTPVSHWPRITPAQAEELKALRFYTVENIANASDAALQNLGMVAGVGGHSFREMAQRFLKSAAGDASLSQAEERNKELEAKIAAQEEAAKLQAEQMAQIQAQLTELLTRKKPGRKPKQ